MIINRDEQVALLNEQFTTQIVYDVFNRTVTIIHSGYIYINTKKGDAIIEKKTPKP